MRKKIDFTNGIPLQYAYQKGDLFDLKRFQYSIKNMPENILGFSMKNIRYFKEKMVVKAAQEYYRYDIVVGKNIDLTACFDFVNDYKHNNNNNKITDFEKRKKFAGVQISPKQSK